MTGFFLIILRYPVFLFVSPFFLKTLLLTCHLANLSFLRLIHKVNSQCLWDLLIVLVYPWLKPMFSRQLLVISIYFYQLFLEIAFLQIVFIDSNLKHLLKPSKKKMTEIMRQDRLKVDVSFFILFILLDRLSFAPLFFRNWHRCHMFVPTVSINPMNW